jgi:hypothetical protein
VARRIELHHEEVMFEFDDELFVPKILHFLEKKTLESISVTLRGHCTRTFTKIPRELGRLVDGIFLSLSKQSRRPQIAE